MVVRVDVARDLLHWAVERAGWDEETVERRVPMLDEWKAGTIKPTLKQLEKFATDTHTPFGLLFLPEPPVEEVPIPDMRTIGNVVVPRPSADLLDTIYLCQSRQEWYRNYAQENAAVAREFVGSATTATAPTLIADQMRDMLGFDLTERGMFSDWNDALRRLIDRIEATGVLVMVNGIVGANTHRVLNPEEFRGFALADPLAPLIFVNGADTKAAQIFTMIHELAHIWLGQSALSDAAMLSRGGVDEEQWCNQVAAEVLLPLAALRVDYRGEANKEELERLARKYRVSTLVVLKRIFDAHLLNWDTYQERYKAERERIMGILAARKGDDGGGNYYYTQPLRLSRQFAQAVIASAFEGTTTYRDAYRLLGTKKHSTFAGLAAELGVV
ncbi:ImmA/IrrE family metallo-endopeptidase [Flaviflexus huanghaiensis]|uniref:ImmA/IrrE family metallo-endopeptidase n=1 Tax=Flaviflexus huanghaiensis TaxID=1111473 RepID=UPI0015FD8C73|nr:ImmA/IrrE family metallo-endopeptidase [Flaviflexus huanghaiensis]